MDGPAAAPSFRVAMCCAVPAGVVMSKVPSPRGRLTRPRAMLTAMSVTDLRWREALLCNGVMLDGDMGSAA